MDKVFVVLSHFSDSNSHVSSLRVVCVTCSKSSADKLVSELRKSHFGLTYEIVETDIYE